MKRILLALVASIGLMVTTSAQVITLNTNTSPPMLSGPFIDVLDKLSTGSNWMVAPYGIYSFDDKKAGAGLAILYDLTPAGYSTNSPTVGTGIRFEYYDENFSVVQGNIQFNVPLTIAGKVTLIPFGYTGIESPMSGNDTSVSAVFGAGMSAVLFGKPSGAHLSLFGVWEINSSHGRDRAGGGLAYKF